jgi:hypothetical protein
VILSALPGVHVSDHEPSNIFKRLDIPHRVAARLGRMDNEPTAAYELRLLQHGIVLKADESPSVTAIRAPAPTLAEHAEAKRRLLRADTLPLPEPVPHNPELIEEDPVMLPAVPPPVSDAQVLPFATAPRVRVGDYQVPLPLDTEPPASVPSDARPRRSAPAPVEADEEPTPRRRTRRSTPPPPVEADEEVTPAHRRRHYVKLAELDDTEDPRRQRVGASRPPAQRAGHFNQWDWVLFAIVTIMELVTWFTTFNGAGQFLPWGMAIFASIGVLALLWVFLTGLAGKNLGDLTRWAIIGVLAAFVVYCSFFTYHEGLADETLASQANARAEAAHAQVVGSIYTGRLTEAQSQRALSVEMLAQSEAEKIKGGRTGYTGYGPEAKRLKASSDTAGSRAAELEPVLAMLEPLVHPADTSPEGLFASDVALWQAAPAAWREGVALPVRGSYIDEAHENKILLPIQGVMAGDNNAIMALVVAGGVEGMVLLAGTGIEWRRRRPLLERLTRMVTSLIMAWRTAVASWQHALGHEANPDWVGRDEDKHGR